MVAKRRIVRVSRCKSVWCASVKQWRCHGRLADFAMTFTYWMSPTEARKRFHLLKDCIFSKPGEEPLAPFLIDQDRQRLDCPQQLVRRHTQFDGPSNEHAFANEAQQEHSVGIMGAILPSNSSGRDEPGQY